jgi:hypothetical protein
VDGGGALAGEEERMETVNEIYCGERERLTRGVTLRGVKDLM